MCRATSDNLAKRTRALLYSPRLRKCPANSGVWIGYRLIESKAKDVNAYYFHTEGRLVERKWWN